MASTPQNAAAAAIEDSKNDVAATERPRETEAGWSKSSARAGQEKKSARQKTGFFANLHFDSSTRAPTLKYR